MACAILRPRGIGAPLCGGPDLSRHPHLLVRDTLAAVFVGAARGGVEDAGRVASLARWARNEDPGMGLEALGTEDSSGLFTCDGQLQPAFAGSEDYVRDRARRFEAACDWIERDGLADDAMQCARAAWDAGLFFEVHELLEPVWAEDRTGRRTVLQGMIMAGTAIHHLIGGNTAGAIDLLLDGGQHLRAGAPDPEYDVEGFADGLERLARQIEAGEVSHPGDIDPLPTLERLHEIQPTPPRG